MALSADELLEALSKLAGETNSNKSYKDSFPTEFSKYAETFKTAIDRLTDGAKLTQDEKLRSNAKEVKVGDRGALGDIISDKEAEIRLRNELLSKYKEEEEAFTRISDMRKQSEIELTNLRAKNNDFSATEEQKLQADILKNYKDMYNEISVDDKKLYAEADAAEAEIYKKAIAEHRKLSEDELAELKKIEEFRLTSEENRAKAEAERYKQANERWDKFSSAIIKTTNRVLNAFATLTSDVYLFDRIREGSKNFTNEYERQFTPIAGYTGSESREDTHSLITDTLGKVREDEALTKGLKFNEEVFPEITKAVKNGFLGEEAQNIAITNAVDQKIMPWLETSSDTWVQLQYNLTEDRLQQIKGQQLLLQETREGNRILQSGVVQQIQDALVPTLQAIDANTVSEESMGDAYEIVETLKDRGMDKTSAVKFTRDLIEADQHTYKALTSNDTSKILMGMGAMNGGGISGAFSAYSDTVGKMLSNAQGDEIAIGAIDSIIGGNYLPADYDNYANIFDFDLTGKYNNKDFNNIYSSARENLPEDVTATFAYDAERENKYAEKRADVNLTAHGADMYQEMLTQVKIIKDNVIKLVIGYGIAKTFEPLLNKAGEKLGKTVFGKLLGKGAQEAGKTAAEQTVTGGRNLVQSLTKGGINSPLSGIALIGGGLLEGYEGIKAIDEGIDIKNDKTSNDIQNSKANVDIATGTVAVGAGTTAAIAGGTVLATGGTAAAGTAAAAAGPIGWAALAIGALAIGIKKYSDHLAELDDATGRMTENFNKAKDSLDEENDSRKKSLLAIEENVKEFDTTAEKLEYLQKNGIDTTNLKLSSGADTQEKVNKELQKYLDNLIQANDELTAEAQIAIDEVSAELKNNFNDNVDSVKEALIENYSAEALREKYKGKDDDFIWEMQETFLRDVGGYSSEELKSMYTHFKDGPLGEKELKGVFDKGAVDGKNIGSWEDRIEQGKVDVSKANTKLRVAGVTDVQLVDDEELLKDIGPYAQAIEYLTKYRDYGREKDKVTENIPTEFSQDTYDSYKESILSAQESSKPALEILFKNQGDSEAMSDWPNSLKGYKLGSTYIPEDQLAILHEGERVLTEAQNKDYTRLMTEMQNLQTQVPNQSIIDTSIISENNNDIVTKQEAVLKDLGYTDTIIQNNSNLSSLLDSGYTNTSNINRLDSLVDSKNIATPKVSITQPEIIDNNSTQLNNAIFNIDSATISISSLLQNQEQIASSWVDTGAFAEMIKPVKENIISVFGKALLNPFETISNFKDLKAANRIGLLDDEQVNLQTAVNGGLQAIPEFKQFKPEADNSMLSTPDFVNPSEFIDSNNHTILALDNFMTQMQFNKDNKPVSENSTEFIRELQPSNTSTIQAGVTDIVTAIRQQTSDIINYLREASVTNAGSFQKLNMSPAMSNTRVTW